VRIKFIFNKGEGKGRDRLKKDKQASGTIKKKGRIKRNRKRTSVDSSAEKIQPGWGK